MCIRDSYDTDSPYYYGYERINKSEVSAEEWEEICNQPIYIKDVYKRQLLLLGKLMRVKIRFIQRLFIPPSLLAGFIGLSLGPHGFGLSLIHI